MSRSKISVAKWVGAFLLSFCSFSFSNAQPAVGGATTPVVTNPTFYDDTYVHVPLQFGFPFYGRTFTNSWMHSNGVVSFLDPAAPIEGAGYNPGAWAYCCGDRPNGTTPQFNYMIAPLWTDLYPDGVSTFRTEGTANYQKYFWNNLGEISNTNNRNTFSLEIRPSGFIGVDYTQINMRQTAWVGTVGNATSGQVNEIYYGSPGINYTGLTGWTQASTPADACFANPLSSPTCSGYTEAMCASNPLYSQTCSGYQQAYLNQQCSANPLYNTACPGYAAAYLSYQCSINPLYSTTCEGYETAYFNQQCSENPLYNTRCPGYAEAYRTQQCSINPLFSTTCDGYESAYLNQQCSQNPLYSTQCTGYAAAYFTQQCSLNPLYNQDCPGYGQAYFNQQCSLNALYDSNCTGYSQAYHSQQCSLNALYASDCPNYQEAYFSQQCSLNGLYSTSCPNYATAYATQQALLASQRVATPTTTTITTVTPTTSTPEPAAVAIVSDPVVNDVVTSTATSTSPAAAATATVTLTPTPAPATAVVEMKVEAKQEQKTEEKKADTSSSSVSSSTTASNTSTETKPAAPTARQQLQARREAAAKAKAVEDGKNLAANMGKIADMEAQKQVQNVVIAAMGFTPGFDNYNIVRIQDAQFYRPVQLYKNNNNVDNAIASRRMFGGSDRLHEQMVDSQYRR